MSQNLWVVLGLLIPLAGTTAGASFAFFMRRQELAPTLNKALLGFASGVMIAASVWSLLIPAIEMSEASGKAAWLPPAIGFMLGIFFLLFMDSVIPHLHADSDEPEGPKTSLSKVAMLVFAVTLHNIPEGMAVGVVFAAFLQGQQHISLMGAMTLAIGIAIQNLPEGAIISAPLRAAGASRKKSFLYGFLSGVVEPLAALLTIALTTLISSILPYLLALAAGAMIYVVVEELIPETAEGEHSNAGILGCAFGFVIMMVLDVALG